VACSKTSRTPSLVFAEHSRYLYAPIFLRISSPCTHYVSTCSERPYHRKTLPPLHLCMVRIFCISYLLGSNGFLAGLVKFFDSLLVITQILLTTNKNDRESTAEVKDFGNPLFCTTRQRFSYRMEKMKLKFVGHTFSCTLSSESGESTAKQMRITCESGYERGRRRS
jgi:hypothetical protein